MLRILVAAVMAGQEGNRCTRNGIPHANDHDCLTNGSNSDPARVCTATVVRELLPRFTAHMEFCNKEFAEPKKVSSYSD